MNKVKFDLMVQQLKRWAPPLIGIPIMLFLAYRFEVARFLLFGHHLFWVIAVILVIIALSHEPSSTGKKRKTGVPSKRRQMADEHKPPRPMSASETPAARLAHLREQKEVIDRRIRKLTIKDKERLK